MHRQHQQMCFVYISDISIKIATFVHQFPFSMFNERSCIFLLVRSTKSNGMTLTWFLYTYLVIAYNWNVNCFFIFSHRFSRRAYSSIWSTQSTTCKIFHHLFEFQYQNVLTSAGILAYIIWIDLEIVFLLIHAMQLKNHLIIKWVLKIAKYSDISTISRKHLQFTGRAKTRFDVW